MRRFLHYHVGRVGLCGVSTPRRVLHPYRLVKDVRTAHETSNVDGVLDGALEPFVKAYLIAHPSDDA